MAVARVFARGRVLAGLICTFRATPRPFSPIKTTIAARQLSFSSRLPINASQSLGEEVPAVSPETEVATNPQQIHITGLNRRATPHYIEQMLKSHNLEPKRLLLHMDRFRLHVLGSRCAVEFGSEEEATKAIEVLNGTRFMNKTINVRPLFAQFFWGLQADPSLYFVPSETTVAEVFRPLSEGRRMLLSVATPGWGDKKLSVSERAKLSVEIIEKHLGPYGLEARTRLSPFFGDMTSTPRMLCQVDFATAEGAERAAKEIHDTKIKDRLVWLRLSTLSPWTAHQIGLLDPQFLADLQSKGLAPEAVEHRAIKPKDETTEEPKNKKKKTTKGRVKTDAKSAHKAVPEKAATQA